MTATEDDARVLVAYASRGRTAGEVAARIAARLHDEGIAADVAPLDAAGDPARADAVVLGSAVYDQRWLPEAERFVREHADALAARPLWLFSVGSLGDSGRLLGPLVRREPRGIGALRRRLGARDYRVFAGRVRTDGWPRAGRLVFRLLGGRDGDARDPAAIDAWAASIAGALRTAAAPRPRAAAAGPRR